MNRKRAFLVGLLCGTCVTAAVALLARRVEPPASPAPSAVAATTVVPAMPSWDYVYNPDPFILPAPNVEARPLPVPEGRTFNGQPLYVIPLGAVAAR